MARRPPRKLGVTEWQRAKNITQTVVWRTGGPKAMENVIYFEHPEKLPKIVPREIAKYITHSDTF